MRYVQHARRYREGNETDEMEGKLKAFGNEHQHCFLYMGAGLLNTSDLGFLSGHLLVLVFIFALQVARFNPWFVAFEIFHPFYE